MKIMKNPTVKIFFAILLSVLFNLTVPAQKAELVVQTGHNNNIVTIAFSPDGKILATGSMDETVKLWDAATGRELRTFPGHAGGARSVAFSADGKILVSGGYDETIELWDVMTGEVKKIPHGHDLGRGVSSIAVWPTDGKIQASGSSNGTIRLLASGGPDRTIRLLDMATGVVKIFDIPYDPDADAEANAHFGDVTLLAFSPDVKTLAAGHDEKVSVWDLNTKKVKTFKNSTGSRVMSAVYSSDGATLAAADDDHNVRLWNTKTWNETVLSADTDRAIDSMAHSPDGNIIASGNMDGTIGLWSVPERRFLKPLPGHSGKRVTAVAFSPDSKILASGGEDGGIKLWDMTAPEPKPALKTITGRHESVGSFALSRDGKMLAVGSAPLEIGQPCLIRLWNLAEGGQLKVLSGHTARVGSLAFSKDGKTLASGSDDNTLRLWDTTTGQELKKIPSTTGSVNAVAFSEDSTILAVGSDNSIRLWDTATWEEFKFIPRVKTIPGEISQISALAFSPDSATLASGGYDKKVRLWKVATGNLKTFREFKTHPEDHEVWAESVAFSPDGTTLASRSEDGTVWLWKVATAERPKAYKNSDPKTAGEFRAIVLDYYLEGGETARGGRFQVKKGSNNKFDLIELKTGKVLASLVAVDKEDWAVVTPGGLFDASSGAGKSMHYTLGLETVSLNQMKQMYYLPGLLPKIFRNDPLPQVELFTKKDLYPSVEFSLQPEKKQLTIKLTDRGGGIGPVQVLINGKELIADARPANFNPKDEITVDLSNASIKPGEENKIEIIARNRDGSLSTRGSRGGEIILEPEGEKPKETPHIYAIIAGISSYTGDGVKKLAYAASDAETMAKAIDMGAAKLLGDKTKVHIRLLTSNGARSTVEFNSPDAKKSTATKNDFRTAFGDFKNATSNDVFIVYLAGHGISLGLDAGDTYLYLTQEAKTTDKSEWKLEKTRDAEAISSAELKDLMKQNKALKQVLILDTCAAGALSASLSGKRDLPSDQIRAIDNLKDSTGFFVLMGSSADAVSYEDSRYGHGLLTYSLLQGMKGAGLREAQYADVNALFNFAQGEVPKMAKHIQGIQRPLILMPDNSKTFDIGKFTVEDQKLINLAAPKQVILSPVLLNGTEGYDDLELADLLRKELRNISFQPQAQLSFAEAEQMADAIKPSGLYLVKDGVITVTVRLIRNNKPVSTFTVTGKVVEKEALVKAIVARLVEAAQIKP